MTIHSSLDYFETDLVKHAVTLWKLARRAREADFDVLRFGRDWSYADGVLQQCLASEQEAVSDAALELMQLRTRFQIEQPARALKIGAPAGASTVSSSAIVPAAPVTAAHTASAPAAAPAEPPTRYLKSLR